MGPHGWRLLRGRNEVLLEFAVGVGVGGEFESAAGVDNCEAAEGHAAAEFGLSLANLKRLAERSERGLDLLPQD